MECRERESHARGVYPTQGYLVHGKSKGEAIGRSRRKNNSERSRRKNNSERSRRKNNSKRVVTKSGRNVGTIRRKSPKQGLTSAKDLTLDLTT